MPVPARTPKLSTTRNAGPMAAPASLSLATPAASIYDDTGANAEYYMLLSDDPTANYDRKTANLKITTGYVLNLDLYNDKSNPVELAAGEYAPAATFDNFTYDPDYTCLAYYEDGEQVSVAAITAAVNVQRDDSGVYTITTNTVDGTLITYRGKIPFVKGNEKPSVYDQIKEDLTVNLDKGGIAFYQGVTDYSNNGVTYLNLFDCSFNVSGGMTEPGMTLAMMIAHKRVVRKSAFKVFPGTYTNNTNLARDTWYPCKELEYNLGGEYITMPFGSFLHRRDANGNHTYAYLKTGTFVIEEEPDGTYSGTIDAVTDLGYTIKGTFSGQIALDTSNANMSFVTAISNLEDDVECDFSKIETARLYHTGEQGGCRTFKLDMGSPYGLDAGIQAGGDLVRLEFLSPMEHSLLEPGVYNVVPVRWNSYELQGGGTYEPMSLNKGHFNTSGGCDGTNYSHFADGRYYVLDIYAPVEEGSVRVETDDYQNYRVTLDLVDDAGFKITGVYDGPVTYMYNPDAISGIEDIDGEEEMTIVVDGRNIKVLNADDAPVELYDMNGRMIASGKASASLDASGLVPNIYILKVNNTAFKVILK